MVDIFLISNIQEIEYYINFTRQVFNYLNGRVNKYNTAINLDIKGYHYHDDLFGRYELPNTILVYLYNIIYTIIQKIYNNTAQEEYKDYYIKSIIMYTIIHELHHCEETDNRYFTGSDDTINRLETGVDKAVFKYITENKNTLENDLDFKISMAIINASLSKGDHYHRYNRCNNLSKYYMHIIRVIIWNKIQIDLLSIPEYIPNINLIINDITINIQNNYIPNSNIDYFNQIIYKYFGINTYSITHDIKLHDNNTIIDIYLNISKLETIPIRFYN